MLLPLHEKALLDKLFRHGLMEINSRRKIVKSLALGSGLDNWQKVMYRVFEHPEILDEHIKLKTGVYSDEEIAILKSWRDHFILGNFAVLRDTSKYALLMSIGAKEDRVYGVVSINDSITKILPYTPAIINTTILPFCNKIVFTGILKFVDKRFSGEELEALNLMYTSLKNRYGIVASLPYKSKKI
ncbi:MAG: hypothetical protein LBC41_07995 [Clostridiales bacterium]|jgi:hypothetical protein|nr:hypothetical protein [Clostridiales bacterium]